MKTLREINLPGATRLVSNGVGVQEICSNLTLMLFTWVARIYSPSAYQPKLNVDLDGETKILAMYLFWK